MSDVYVDEIHPRLSSRVGIIGGLSANNEIVGPSIITNSISARDAIYGDGANITNTGKLGQIVQTVKTDPYYRAGAGSWDDVSGLNVAITPTSTTSKIWIQACISIGGDSTSMVVKFKRNIGGGSYATIDGATGDSSGSRTRATSKTHLSHSQHMNTIPISYIDSPSTTLALIYKIQAYSHSNSYAISVNRPVWDNDEYAGNFARCISTITVVEILE